MRKKTKVIELINGIADGGAETLVKDYAVNIDKECFTIFVVTENGAEEGSANANIIRQNNIKIYAPFFERTSMVKKIFRKIQNKTIRPKYREKYKFWCIKHVIRRIQPDVIHVHMKMLKYLAPIADELKGIKLLYTCHSLPYRYFNENECKEELETARYLVKHNNLRFVALHDEMREELNNMFGVGNTIVLNNCVDLQRFRNVKASKEEIRQALGIPNDAFVLGHVGRFVWLKNQPFVVDIFNEVVKKQPNAFLLFVGSGDASRTIDKLRLYNLEDKCLILSNRADVPQLLKAMDVFMFPSILEGLPIACIEAQAVGLRCVISSNVTKEVFFSEKAIEAGLDEDPVAWTEKILNCDIRGLYRHDIEAYGIPQVMNSVKSLYLE